MFAGSPAQRDDSSPAVHHSNRSDDSPAWLLFQNPTNLIGDVINGA
jgi:hypothetical protein